MRILSKAFFRLKTTLPWVPKDTKLSKLDTLRLATSYILHLKMLLSQQQDDPSHTHKEQWTQVLNVNWPFGFQAPDLTEQTLICADEYKTIETRDTNLCNKLEK
ncbi:hypothetical protein M8J77_009231 [Diaphorina citri]|nr:hypothetical protein M8J77_009231 [Diaphorina citri]